MHCIQVMIIQVTVLIFCAISSDAAHGDEATFNVLKYGAVGDGNADDSEAFVKAWQDLCRAAGTSGIPLLHIPRRKAFLLQPSKFEGPCKSESVHIQIMGSVVAPKTLQAWKKFDQRSWLSFRNIVNLTLDGSGKIDGRGSPWWMRKNVEKRPAALHFDKCNNLRMSGITHLNSPKAHISISHCNDVDISNLTITAPILSPNTDGIDISNSKRVNIHDSRIGTGDDCIAINGGCSDLNINKIACGPGHGISVRSLGKNGAKETVENVQVKNCSFSGTQNGARIKTWQGGSGYVRNITFEQIILNAAKNPIVIDQYYCNGKRTCSNQTSAAVAVGDVTYRDFEGTCANEEAIQLHCNQISGCFNIVMEHISMTSSTHNKVVSASCFMAKGTSISTVPSVSCLHKIKLVQ